MILLYNRYLPIIIQEYIKTDYDIRVVVWVGVGVGVGVLVGVGVMVGVRVGVEVTQ